jgi:hypothetical protein
MKRNTALTSTYANGFDTDGTLTQQSLSKAHPEPLKRIARGVLVAIGIALCIMPDAGGSKPMQYVSYKEYSLHLLHYDYIQYKCLTILWGKESAWNPEAVGNLNGSQRVYGIPQGKSEWLKDQDGYAQVRWGLSYIDNRHSTPCKALDHWKVHNWY